MCPPKTHENAHIQSAVIKKDKKKTNNLNK